MKAILMILFLLLSGTAVSKQKLFTPEIKQRLEKELPIIIDNISPPFTVAKGVEVILRELDAFVKKDLIHPDSFEGVKKLVTTIDNNLDKEQFKAEALKRFRFMMKESEEKGPVCKQLHQSCHEMPCCEGYTCLNNAPLSFPRSKGFFHYLSTLEKQLSKNAQNILASLYKVCDSKVKNKKQYKDCIENLYLQYQLLIKDEKSRIIPLKEIYPSCVETDQECTKNSECCSKLCNKASEKAKKKTCAPVAICVPKLDIGGLCLPNVSACPVGSFCQKSNLNSTHLQICTEDNKDCKEDQECCSEKCHKKKCLPVHRCAKCIEGFKKIKTGQECCQGFYNVDGTCMPDSPPYPPQVKLTPKKNIWISSLLFAINLIIPSAEAALTEADLPQDVKNQIAAERATCNAMTDATKKNECLAEVNVKVQQQMKIEEQKQIDQYAISDNLVADEEFTENKEYLWGTLTAEQRANCMTEARNKISEGAGSTADVPDSIILDEAKSICYQTQSAFANHTSFDDIGNVFEDMQGFVLSDEQEGGDPNSASYNCMFNLRAQDYAAMSDLQKKSELILLAFEFVATGQGSDDCWDSKNDNLCTGGNTTIHAQSKKLANTLKTSREKRYQNLERAEKELRCTCLDLKTISSFSEPWATNDVKDYYRTNCPNGSKLDDPTYKDPDEQGLKADGVKYTELLLQSIKTRQTQMEEMFKLNTLNSAQMQGFLVYLKSLPFHDVNKVTATYYKTVREHIWLLVLGILFTIVAFCLIPVLSGIALGIAVAVFAIGMPLGAVLYELTGSTPSETCTEVGKTPVYWPCEPILVAYDVRMKCETVEMIESAYCGFELPNALCIKSALTLRDDATVSTGDIRYLIDPMIPKVSSSSSMNSFHNTKFISPKDQANFELGNNFLESHRQEFITLAKTFTANELYFSPDDLTPYAKYIYKYHFLGKAVAAKPKYPTPGLIPYFEMIDNALQTLSYQQADQIHKINSYYQKVFKYYDKLVKGYDAGENISPEIAEDYQTSLKVTELFENFKYNSAHSNLKTMDFSTKSSSSTGSNQNTGSADSTRLGSLQDAFNKAAGINREQYKKYEHWKNTVGKTKKGQRLLTAHNRYQKAGITSSMLNQFRSTSQRHGTPEMTSNQTANSNSSSEEKKKNDAKAKSKINSKKSNDKDNADEFFDFEFDVADLNAMNVIGSKEIKEEAKNLIENLDEENKALHKKEGLSLFKIITKRYFASGYRKLLSIKKKENAKP